MWPCPRCGIIHNSSGTCLCGAEIRILRPAEIGEYIERTWDDAHIYYIVDSVIVDDIAHYVIFRVPQFVEIRYTVISVKLPHDADVDSEFLHNLIDHLQVDYLYDELENIYNEYKNKIMDYKIKGVHVTYPLQQHLHNIAKKLNTSFFDLFGAYYLYYLDHREEFMPEIQEEEE